jgi:tetratricopeptide (TPR) repeat protein
MAAAFVTIDDAGVDRFARGMVATYGKLLRERFGNSNISKAMLLFDAVGAYGIRYQIDKSTPWDAVAADSTAFDTIQYPSELFVSKIGDCDDLTVLYASLLGNLGIDTAFLEANDPAFPHIYLMFDAGIDPNSVADHFLDESEYVLWNDKVWMPVETTMFTEFSFTEAWRRGREEYYSLKPRGYIQETHVWEASQVYPPGKIKAAEIQLPGDRAVNTLHFDRSVAEFDRRVEQIASRLAVSLEDADGLYEAGAYYIRIGRLDKALEMMDRVLAKDPAYGDAYNAKGVIYTKRRDYDRALEFYNRALALMPEETGIRMNIALLYYLKNEPEKVREEAKQLQGTGYEEVIKDYVREEKVPERKIEIKK